MTSISSIFDLIHNLGTRSGRAIVSQLGLRSSALRGHLLDMFGSGPGEPGALLADPVIEAAFGWKLADTDMQGLAQRGLLRMDLVSSMDKPTRDYRNHAFPSKRIPFQHQVDCWKHLLDDQPRSVLISSGTGSGKTECFLVPILNDLAQECEQSGKPTGVRAIFLYPLNALINSQRDRLRAWCGGFEDDIRFCLYNGETPSFARADDQRRAGAEQISREALRKDAAPLLVTNSTMLEYMLVRAEDQPILDQSQGKLRWIVLDEAHTYVGSQAAELALLLRRVTHRFGVDPSNVRFVATSATIGGSEAVDDLRRFLADVSGAPQSQVHVIIGERLVPRLPPVTTSHNAQHLEHLEDAEQYDALCQNPAARAVHSRLIKGPATLKELREATGLKYREFIELLDQASTARRNGEQFLPLRVHLFHRTQSGLWACVNPSCSGRNFSLDEENWGFGALFPSRRTSCIHCEYPVFELIACGECGQEYLSAVEEFSGETGIQELKPYLEQTKIDEFQLEIDPDDEDIGEIEPTASMTARRLVCGGGSDLDQVDNWWLNSEGVLSKRRDGIAVRLSQLDTKAAIVCPRCGAADSRHRPFRELRIGAPFMLSTIIPTALEHTPPMHSGSDLPSQGRRLLGFSDSRQGSARMAVRLQQEAERNRVRSVLFHSLIAERRHQDTSDLERQVEELRPIAKTPSLRSLLEDREAELAQARAGERIGSLSWADAAERLTGDMSLLRMHERFRDTSYISASLDEFANFCLFREFFRRPKRMNSVETMGLISITYPSLTKTEPRDWPFPSEDWSIFLKLVVDFFLRDVSAVNAKDEYLRWMGIPVRKKYILGSGHEGAVTSRQRRWPSIGVQSRPSRLPRLLQKAYRLDDSLASHDKINVALNHAWQALSPHFQQLADGFLLKLDEIAVFSELQSGQICPYTGRVLDTTLRRISPYLPQRGEPELCRHMFKPPKVPMAYWRDKSGGETEQAEIASWLGTNPDICRARELGVWSNLNDRIVANAQYFEAAEHSAQLNGTRLRALESRFKNGELNVLSCSTTMEMGVDIGGLSAVIMNNAPPSSANYLQRAGRAGRRGESLSFAVTLCPSSPHGELVFNNPMWPFTSTPSVPRVALDSERLVQRHVNSLCLGIFLENRDARRLKCGWFFQADDSSGTIPGLQFVSWCRHEASMSKRLINGIKWLIRRTALDSTEPERLLDASAEALEGAMNAWRQEVDSLRKEASQFKDGSNQSKAPAVLAIERQLGRLENEYLLGELANRQFLPGYGFPSGIVTFVPITIEELKRRRSDHTESDQELGKRLGYPSREMEIAIREYAPGTEVVMDGRVYESGGLTLNWHLPPEVEELQETQALRHVWRCRGCGATGDAVSPTETCSQCGGMVNSWKYLEPAGFAVDIRHTPHNNIVAPSYIPVEPPWISCPTPEWSTLANPSIGRFRYTDKGHLFHGNKGNKGYGYAVCMRCGRAASEDGPASETELPEALREGHFRLRGGKEPNGQSQCKGTGFAIQRGLSLGGSRATDVFELQLAGLSDEDTALSIGVALRAAFCRRNGIEDREVGVVARPTRASDGTIQQSIFLYDLANGGNGFVASLRDQVASALKEAVEILYCTNECDTACHGCLLNFGTQYDWTKLNRVKALGFLTTDFLSGLNLRQSDQLLGPNSRILTRPLFRHLAELAGEPEVREIRLSLGGNSGSWDVEDFPLYSDMLRWTASGRLIRLFITTNTLASVPTDCRHALASLVAAGRGQIKVHSESQADVSRGTIVAAVERNGGSILWAMPNAAPPMNEAWGNPLNGGPIVYSRIDGPLPKPTTRALETEELRPRTNGAAILRINHELNGLIEGFGQRFWASVSDGCKSLNDRFKQDNSLRRVEYVDRYLASPWALILMREVLLGLAREGSADSGTLLRVLTRKIQREYRYDGYSRAIYDPWQDENKRRLFLEQIIHRGGDRGGWEGSFRFDTGDPPHFRQLSLEWSDGVKWTLKLDQGFGYWRHRGYTAFPFDGSPSEQIKFVNKIAKSSKVAATPEYPTFVYVSEESRWDI